MPYIPPPKFVSGEIEKQLVKTANIFGTYNVVTYPVYKALCYHLTPAPPLKPKEEFSRLFHYGPVTVRTAFIEELDAMIKSSLQKQLRQSMEQIMTSLSIPVLQNVIGSVATRTITSVFGGGLNLISTFSSAGSIFGVLTGIFQLISAGLQRPEIIDIPMFVMVSDNNIQTTDMGAIVIEFQHYARRWAVFPSSAETVGITEQEMKYIEDLASRVPYQTIIKYPELAIPPITTGKPKSSLSGDREQPLTIKRSEFQSSKNVLIASLIAVKWKQYYDDMFYPPVDIIKEGMFFIQYAKELRQVETEKRKRMQEIITKQWLEKMIKEKRIGKTREEAVKDIENLLSSAVEKVVARQIKKQKDDIIEKAKMLDFEVGKSYAVVKQHRLPIRLLPRHLR